MILYRRPTPCTKAAQVGRRVQGFRDTGTVISSQPAFDFRHRPIIDRVTDTEGSLCWTYQHPAQAQGRELYQSESPPLSSTPPLTPSAALDPYQATSTWDSYCVLPSLPLSRTPSPRLRRPDTDTEEAV